MRKSIFVRTNCSDVGRNDWWPLEILVDAARRAINSTAQYGHIFPCPANLVPVCRVESIGDLPKVSEHAKALLTLVKRQHDELRQILAMPGLLGRRPDPSLTFDMLNDAAESFYELGMVARQIAGACLQSVVYDPTIAVTHPRIKDIVQAWNAALHDFAETFVTHVEAIPGELAGVLAAARTGQTQGFNINFNFSINFEQIQVAVDAMQADVTEKHQELKVLQALLDERRQLAERRAGKIYALVNPSMPGLVKIGKTTRDSELRADELHTTGVPTPFIVIYEVHVADCDEAEIYMHDVLAGFRVSDRREFFRVEPKIAVDAMTALRQGPASTASESPPEM